jgi:RNA polymerase sigma factor (sigma-70 family)
MLYREHAADAFRYALHLTGKRADAEDIVQHVFLQAHRHLESGRELVSPRAWLLTAVKHRAFNLARDRREIPVDEPVLTVAPADTGGDEAGQLADVRGMLWTLPELQHHAFVLRHWNGLSQNEIAAVLGTTPSAVESLLRRARSGLLQAHNSASEVCTEIQHRLLESAELGVAGEAHLQTCRPCRQARTRLARAANLAGTLALVPGTHVADAIAGLVPGFSPHAAASAMAGAGTAGAGTAGAGTAGGAGAGGGAGGAAAWGTTTAVTTVSKVVFVAKAVAVVAAATVAVGAIPPAHQALSAVLAGHAPGSGPGTARTAASTRHARRGDHGAQAQPPAARTGTPAGAKRQRPVTPPGKHRGSGRGAGAGGKPADTGGGQANANGNGKALGAGGGNAGGNRNAPGKAAKAGGSNGNAGGGKHGAGEPPGVGGNGRGKGTPAGPGGGKHS